jgi:hypothetical protein
MYKAETRVLLKERMVRKDGTVESELTKLAREMEERRQRRSWTMRVLDCWMEKTKRTMGRWERWRMGHKRSSSQK